MNTKDVIQSQYRAVLAMLQETVIRCPEPIWNRPEDINPFWQVAYHALFFTHLYLQPNGRDFVPWAKAREGYHKMERVSDSYQKEDIQEYLEICLEQVEEQVPALDLDAPSGFYWLKFNKLELQFYNIRHIQQHTGELCERLGVTSKIDINWVGQCHSDPT